MHSSNLHSVPGRARFFSISVFPVAIEATQTALSLSLLSGDSRPNSLSFPNILRLSLVFDSLAKSIIHTYIFPNVPPCQYIPPGAECNRAGSFQADHPIHHDPLRAKGWQSGENLYASDSTYQLCPNVHCLMLIDDGRRRPGLTGVICCETKCS